MDSRTAWAYVIRRIAGLWIPEADKSLLFLFPVLAVSRRRTGYAQRYSGVFFLAAYRARWRLIPYTNTFSIVRRLSIWSPDSGSSLHDAAAGNSTTALLRPLALRALTAAVALKCKATFHCSIWAYQQRRVDKAFIDAAARLKSGSAGGSQQYL